MTCLTSEWTSICAGKGSDTGQYPFIRQIDGTLPDSGLLDGPVTWKPLAIDFPQDRDQLNSWFGAILHLISVSAWWMINNGAGGIR